MFRRRRLGFALAAAIIGAAVLAPGIGSAGQTSYDCGPKTRRYGQVCVRAVNENLVLLCTTHEGRPTCVGFGVIGGEAHSPTGDGMQMHGWADIWSGPERLIAVGNLSVPYWQRTYQSETWGIVSVRGYGPKKVTRTFFTERAYGPRGGCLTYAVEVRAKAAASTRTGCFGIQQCINGQTYQPPVQHNHTVRQRICAPK